MENTNQDNKITINIDDLTDDEILMILKHRKSKNKTIWDTLKKEPLYFFKDFRRALLREVARGISMYLIIKYGLVELLKR